MRYVKSTLESGETIQFIGKISWLSYTFSIALGVILLPVYFMGVIILICVWLQRKSTEFAVTEQRLIYKTGILSRKTMETQLQKIESIQIDQSLTGRLCNFGTLVIHGTGSGTTRINGLDDPIAVRRRLQEILKIAQSS